METIKDQLMTWTTGHAMAKTGVVLDHAAHARWICGLRSLLRPRNAREPLTARSGRAVPCRQQVE